MRLHREDDGGMTESVIYLCFCLSRLCANVMLTYNYKNVSPFREMSGAVSVKRVPKLYPLGLKYTDTNSVKKGHSYRLA